MVRWRMGLLDDAIREHLELKRLRGADPGEVARQEHEVLGVSLQDGGDSADHQEPPALRAPNGVSPSLDEDLLRSSAAQQETAEIDMRSLLEADDDEEASDGIDNQVELPEGDGQIEDVLEETPEFLQETPEHERLWFEQQPPRDFDFGE
jgi:hypothetical protein